MTKIDDSILRAFPSVNSTCPHFSDRANCMCEWGMSLRDWLAGMALQSVPKMPQIEFEMGTDELAWNANWAYRQADAVLREKAKEKTNE